MAGKPDDFNRGEIENPPLGGKPAVPDYSPDAVLKRIRDGSREEQNTTLQIPGWVPVTVLAVIVIAGWFWYRSLGEAGAPLCVVNTNSDMPLEIRLDGKKIGLASKMIGEYPKAAVMAELSEGKHEVEARNNSGSVLAKETFTVNKGSYGFLWTPLPDTNSSFFLQVTSYGEGAGEYVAKLDNNSLLKPFPEYVTQWFRNNPSSVSVPKGWKCTYERALRRAKSP